MAKQASTTKKTGSVLPPAEIAKRAKAAAKKVNTDVKINSEVTETPEKPEVIQEINELVKIKTELDKSEETLNEKISEAKTTEEVESAIKEEIEKTEKAEEKIEKIINSKPEKKPEITKNNFTGFWNGMSYDY